MQNKYIRINLNTYFNVTNIVSVHHYDSLDISLTKNEYLDFWQIQYVYNGLWHEECDSRVIRIEKGQMAFFSPGSAQKPWPQNDNNPLTELGIISFDCDSIGMDFFAGKVITPTFAERKQLLEIIDLCVSSFEIIEDNPQIKGFKLKEGVSDVTLQHIKIMLERLLILIYNRLTSTHISSTKKTNIFNHNLELVSMVQNFLLENISERLTIEDIASKFTTSPSSLKKIFKEVTGQSVIQFFIDLKINRAKEMIKNSTYPFNLIAEELGFDSTSYFTHLFKRKTNMTPTEYSKSVKNLYF